eukprot:TRINITY_DN16132_c0_g1_i1.p1 TRINITY_DN16132_c0_g1~~TRINITY_DN16132_c0_g1_i1.p1  ORF type:complete len:966 (+),score=313.96 TRINITY_DN16132_c0_g1_i1:134-3031(+)
MSSLTPKQKAFLERTGVAHVVDRLLVGLVREKPAEPWEWVIEQLEEASQKQAEERSAQEAKAASGRTAKQLKSPLLSPLQLPGDPPPGSPPGSPAGDPQRVTISHLDRFKAEGVLNPWERARAYDPHYRAKDTFRQKKNHDVIGGWLLALRSSWTYAQLAKSVFKDPLSQTLLNSEVVVNAVAEPLRLFPVGTSSLTPVQLFDEWLYTTYQYRKSPRLTTLDSIGRYTTACVAALVKTPPPPPPKDLQYINTTPHANVTQEEEGDLLAHGVGAQYLVALKLYAETCELPVPPLSGGSRSFLLELSEHFKSEHPGSPNSALLAGKSTGQLIGEFPLWQHPMVLALLAQRLGTHQAYEQFAHLARDVRPSPETHVLMCNVLLVFIAHYWCVGAAAGFHPATAGKALAAVDAVLNPLLEKILTLRERCRVKHTPLLNNPLLKPAGGLALAASDFPFRFGPSLYALKRHDEDKLVSGIMVLQANDALVTRTRLLRRFAVMLSLLGGEADVAPEAPPDDPSTTPHELSISPKPTHLRKHSALRHPRVSNAGAAVSPTRPADVSAWGEGDAVVSLTAAASASRKGKDRAAALPAEAVRPLPYRWRWYPATSQWWCDEIGAEKVAVPWGVFQEKYALAVGRPPGQSEWEYAALQHLLDYFCNGTVVVSQYYFVFGILAYDSLLLGLKKALEFMCLGLLTTRSSLPPYRPAGATLHQLATYPDPVFVSHGIKALRGCAITFVHEARHWRVDRWQPQHDLVVLLKVHLGGVACCGDRYFAGAESAARDVCRATLSVCGDAAQDDALEVASNVLLLYRPVEEIPHAKDLRKQFIVLGGCAGERCCAALLPMLLGVKVKRPLIDRYILAGVRAAYSTLASSSHLRPEQRAGLLKLLPQLTEEHISSGMAIGEYVHRHGAELARLATMFNDTAAYMQRLCVAYDGPVVVDAWAQPISAAAKKKKETRKLKGQRKKGR